MDPIVLTAGTAVVSAMATDAWQQVHNAVVAWWRQVRPDQAEAVDVALAQARTRVLAARQADDASGERALVAGWQDRLQALLSADPSLAGELRRLLDEELAPVLPAGQPSRTESTVMKAKASGHGRVYMAGRDLHINES